MSDAAGENIDSRLSAVPLRLIGIIFISLDLVVTGIHGRAGRMMEAVIKSLSKHFLV